jgi:hypothetical protein
MSLSVIISTRCDPVPTLVTIHSILNASKSVDIPIEIIVVDNSEDENNREVLRRIIHREYRRSGIIKLIEHKFQCIFTAREEGVGRASGELVMFLDSHMLLGKYCLESFLYFFQEMWDDEKLGIAYGPMCYSRRIEEDSWHDRDPYTMSGLTLNDPRTQPIAFRAVPMMMKKSLFRAIKGYGTLADNRLSWGGGDTHLGMKPLILGYTNWLVEGATAYHLGPFKKNDIYFRQSYMHTVDANKKYLGMLISAYVIGGIEFAERRMRQISSRINADVSDRDLKTAIQLGTTERRWLEENTVRSYEEICKELKKDKSECRIIQIKKGERSSKRKKVLVSEPINLRGLPDDHWRRRIANEICRQNLTQGECI